MAVDLAFKILGGEGSNRLHRVLRSERGLTYGASADIQTLKQGGDFVAETDTRTETTGEALRLMVEEFSRLQRERVHERELADAQAYLAGNFPLTIETPDAIATQVLNAVFYELPLDEIATFRERVQAVTTDDVQRVARAYVKPDRLSIVLVGNASGFMSQLKGLGFADYEVIPIDQLDLTSVTLKREGRRAAAVALPLSRPVTASYTAVSGQGQTTASAEASRGRELIQRVVEAKGGLTRLKGIRTVVADADTTFRLEQGPISSGTKTYVVYPDKFRVDASLAGAEIVQVYNAGDAWMKDPMGLREAPAGMRDEFAAGVRRDTIPLLIAAAEGSLSVRALPEEGKDGTVLKIVEITGDKFPPVKLYIDSQHLIARQAFSAQGADGRSVLAEEAFSDYRTVDGVRVPFKAEVMRNGKTILERTLKDVKFNTEIDPKLFARPQSQ
jgi:hypothetical protein